MIFVDGGDMAASDAWADVLVEKGIVNNKLARSYFMNNSGETELVESIPLFRLTGYYIKSLDYQQKLGYGLGINNMYAIVLNTNLLTENNPDSIQMRVLKADLEWIKAQNGVAYILGHHPEMLKDGKNSKIFKDMNVKDGDDYGSC